MPLHVTDNGVVVSGAVQTFSNGQAIEFIPAASFTPGHVIQVFLDSTAQGANGVPLSAFSGQFTIAGSPTNTAAVVQAVNPFPNATNVPTNTILQVEYNQQLQGSSITCDLGSASSVVLYDSTAGVFQNPTCTLVGGRQVINIAPTNAAFAMQFNKAMDPGTVNPAGNQYVYVYDNNLGTFAPVTITFSADLTTVMLKPTANLAASHSFQLCSYYMADLSGNPQQNFCVGFNTGSGTDTTGPAVAQVSPPSGFNGVGTNAWVQVLFNEFIDAASIGGVTLKQGSSVIPTTATLYDGDQGVQLRPLTPLAPNTTYTINVSGVLDITGNAQTAFPSQSFTTGTGVDLVQPAFVSSNPVSGATNVPVNTTVQVVFSKAMDPAAFDPATSFTLRDPSNNVVPATITFTAGDTTASLQPKSNLTANTQYYLYIGYAYGNHVGHGRERVPGDVHKLHDPPVIR